MFPGYQLVFFRSIMAFFTLLILTRLLGKKQIGQLTFFEYILGITMGSITANLSTNLTIRALPEFTGLITWVALTLIVELIALKYRTLSKITDGEPTIVIQSNHNRSRLNSRQRLLYKIQLTSWQSSKKRSSRTRSNDFYRSLARSTSQSRAVRPSLE